MTYLYGSGLIGFCTPDHRATQADLTMPWSVNSKLRPGIQEVPA